MNLKVVYEVVEVGINLFKLLVCDFLMVGDVGYVIVVIKDIKDVWVGDMIIDVNYLIDKFLVGYCQMQLMVYVGLYLIDNVKFNDLCDVLEKFQLNDVVLIFELESFQVLGFGFCCGFFGMLYMDVI